MTAGSGRKTTPYTFPLRPFSGVLLLCTVQLISAVQMRFCGSNLLSSLAIDISVVNVSLTA